MAHGSNQTTEEVVAGLQNQAEDTTRILAQARPNGPNLPSRVCGNENKSDFCGPAILLLDTNLTPNPDFPGNIIPPNSYHGLIAKGWSGGGPTGIDGFLGAHGVIGRGGKIQGTGVLGLGGGYSESEIVGDGGIGVRGFGGPLRLMEKFNNTSIEDNPPGVGVVGQGGKQTERTNTNRLPHAAGMIGISGFEPVDDLFVKPNLPKLLETGGIGVYGQGAIITLSEVPLLDVQGNLIPGSNVTSGPKEAGVGVLGRGGKNLSTGVDDTIKPGAGVVGLAGDLEGDKLKDRRKEAVDTGVYGAGFDGVFGHGDNNGVFGHGEATGVFGQGGTTGVLGFGNLGVRADGDEIGVLGTGASGRGGVFASNHSAQVQLIPQRTQQTISDHIPVPNPALPEAPAALPKDGKGGDLMVVEINSEGTRQCTLWFCVQGVESGFPVARWAQVLLGPLFNGKA